MEYQISWFFGVLLLCQVSHGLVVPVQGESGVKEVTGVETPSLGKDEHLSQPLIPVVPEPLVKSVPEPDSLAVESHVSPVVPSDKIEHQVLDIPVVLEVKKRVEEEKREGEESRPNKESSVISEEQPAVEQIEGVAEGQEEFEPVLLILTLEPGQYNLYRNAEGKLVKLVDPAQNPISIESQVPREKCFSYFFPSSSQNNQGANGESPVREANPNPNIDSSSQLQASQYQIQSPLPMENAPPLLPGQPLSASTVYFPRETFGMRKSQPQPSPFIAHPPFFLPARNNIHPFLLKSHLGSPTLGHQLSGTEFYSSSNVNSNSNPSGKSDAVKEKKEDVAPASAEKSETLDKSKSDQPQLQSPVRRPDGRSGMRKKIMARTGGIKRTAAGSNNMGRWFWNSGYYDYPPYEEYDYDVYDVYDYDYYSPYQQYQYYPQYYRTASV